MQNLISLMLRDISQTVRERDEKRDTRAPDPDYVHKLCSDIFLSLETRATASPGRRVIEYASGS